MSRRIVLLLALAPLAGCGDGETTAAAGGAGGGGGEGGGDGGAAPEGCVDLSLWYAEPPEGLRVQGPFQLPRHPVGVALGQLHVVWSGRDPALDEAAIVVTSFSPPQLEPVIHRLYTPYPKGLDAAGTQIIDAAIAPDGALAVALYYADDAAPGGVIQEVMLSRLEGRAGFGRWTPPFTRADAAFMHIGWDGEAFALHAVNQSGGGMRLVRIAPDGSELLPDTPVGVITNVFDEFSDFDTDAASGTSRFATSIWGGVWLNGHQRDGTPMSGTEIEGGIALYEGEFAAEYPVVAARGDGAMLVWHDNGTKNTWAQPIGGSPPFASAGALPDPEAKFPPANRALVHVGRWWMAALTGRYGIYGHDLDDDGLVESTQLLVRNRRCEPQGCTDSDEYFDVDEIQAVAFEGEPWLAFRDDSDCVGLRNCPLRIVRVHGACVYETAYELARRAER